MAERDAVAEWMKSSQEAVERIHFAPLPAPPTGLTGGDFLRRQTPTLFEATTTFGPPVVEASTRAAQAVGGVLPGQTPFEKGLFTAVGVGGAGVVEELLRRRLMRPPVGIVPGSVVSPAADISPLEAPAFLRRKAAITTPLTKAEELASLAAQAPTTPPVAAPAAPTELQKEIQAVVGGKAVKVAKPTKAAAAKVVKAAPAVAKPPKPPTVKQVKMSVALEQARKIKLQGAQAVKDLPLGAEIGQAAKLEKTARESAIRVLLKAGAKKAAALKLFKALPIVGAGLGLLGASGDIRAGKSPAEVLGGMFLPEELVQQATQMLLGRVPVE